MEKVIVVFGGSFNPPTNSHFSLAEQIGNEYEEVERVLFMPVSDLYQKEDLLSAQHRVEMLQRVCERNILLEVSTLEVDSPKLLNTIDTLKLVADKYPGYKIWFTMGTDNLRDLPKWMAHEELLKHFKLLVLERDEDKMADIIAADPELMAHKESFIRVKESVRSNCNSTLLREKVRRGKSIRYLVPDEVYYYIEKIGLYTKVATK